MKASRAERKKKASGYVVQRPSLELPLKRGAMSHYRASVPCCKTQQGDRTTVTPTVEEEIRVLVGATAQSDDSAPPTQSKNDLALDDEIAAALYAEAVPLTLAEDDASCTLPSVIIDPPTLRRVHALARSKGRSTHQTVRDLVRRGLASTVKGR